MSRMLSLGWAKLRYFLTERKKVLLLNQKLECPSHFASENKHCLHLFYGDDNSSVIASF